MLETVALIVDRYLQAHPASEVYSRAVLEITALIHLELFGLVTAARIAGKTLPVVKVFHTELN